MKKQLRFLAILLTFVISHTTVAPFFVHTLYGDFELTEPVLIDLFKCQAMERIKYVRQYGTIHYVIKQNKEYTRYEHCVGVWALLRIYGASLEEQIAGLLHDTSHTVFSHVGDVLFRHTSERSSYQDDIHEWYLKAQHIDTLLAQHNISLSAILHKSGNHFMLEQDLPNICADRLEYNLQAGLLTNMLTLEDIATILKNIGYHEGRWFFTDKECAKKLALVSLFNTEHVWGSPTDQFIYTWTAHALNRALDIGLLTPDDIHFSTDPIVWDKLWITDDAIIIECINKIINYKKLVVIRTDQEGTMIIKNKFRGLNPLVQKHGELRRLTDIDDEYNQEYNRVKKQVTEGWSVDCFE